VLGPGFSDGDGVGFSDGVGFELLRGVALTIRMPIATLPIISLSSSLGWSLWVVRMRSASNLLVAFGFGMVPFCCNAFMPILRAGQFLPYRLDGMVTALAKDAGIPGVVVFWLLPQPASD
jgi:hypothetical protein